MTRTIKTKNEIVSAFKELTKGKEFEKITVSDICNRSHYYRRTFYYHFIDKYDLVNWILKMNL